MSSQIDFLQATEVASTRAWIERQGEEFKILIAIEVIEMRLENIVIDFSTLRYLHSQTRCMQLLARLQEPSVIIAFELSGLDVSEFSGLVAWQLKKIGTTLPDRKQRKPGGGRHCKYLDLSADLFAEEEV